MKAVYGLYTTPDAAQLAVNRLKSVGVEERQIQVLSGEPYEEYDFATHGKKSWMTWIAAAGGFAGMATGYFTTVLTQQWWPIDTGGMPIVTNWTNLIVIFELTMLGVVFASVLTFLVTARLPGRLPKIYDPEIADGKILIGVANPSDSNLEKVQTALKVSGGQLKTIA